MSRADEPVEPVLLEGVRRSFGPVRAVDDARFEVRRGEMFGLIGPDGAGKTTTLRIVLGLLRPDSGTVRTLGLDPWRARRRVAARAGYLAQRFSLYEDLSVDENISFFAAAHGVRGWRDRREELLDVLRLKPFRGRVAGRLSGGMRQKLALVCTLIHTPELLVLDEPTTGVDPVSRREFWRNLAHLQREGRTVLLTTPYLDEAERCHRVALMHRGRILTVDTPEALRAEIPGGTLEVIATPRRKAVERLRADPLVRAVETFGERLHVEVTARHGEATAAAAGELVRHLREGGVEVQSYRAIPPSLEDIFIRRIRETEPEATGMTESAS